MTGRLLGLRARLTLAATAVVAVGLAAGAVLLVAVLHRTLLRTLDDSARQRARDVAALVDAGRLSDPVPVAAGTALVQVVDAGARVRAASAGGDRLAPVLDPADLARARAGATVTLDGARLGSAEPLRVVGVPAGPPGDPQTVLVAVPVTEVQGSLRVVQAALAAGAPVLLLTLALLAWVVVGATLRPVAALRQRAEQITDAGGRQRLPVPGARDEVRRLAQTLNRMLDRLAAASARQRSFVADAAHELRSPLANLRTQLEVALVHPGAADWPATGAAALDEAARLARLVDDLLLLARIDAGSPGTGRPTEPVDLAELVRAAVARRPEGRVPVRVDAAGPALLAGDPGALSRVLGNLLDNAVRHAAGEVRVAVAVAGGQVVLTVTDDGPGIPAAERARVFERFARRDDARSRDAGGSGLGLAIVRELVAAYGGQVALEDAAPGLRAVVRWPAA